MRRRITRAHKSRDSMAITQRSISKVVCRSGLKINMVVHMMQILVTYFVWVGYPVNVYSRNLFE